jgi:hypothetical protein
MIEQRREALVLYMNYTRKEIEMDIEIPMPTRGES